METRAGRNNPDKGGELETTDVAVDQLDTVEDYMER